MSYNIKDVVFLLGWSKETFVRILCALKMYFLRKFCNTIAEVLLTKYKTSHLLVR